MHIKIISLLAFLASITFTTAQDDTIAQNTTLNFNCSIFSNSAPFTNRTIISPVPLRISNATICPNDASTQDTRCRTRSYAGGLAVNATTNSSLITRPADLRTMLLKSLEFHNIRTTSTTIHLSAISLNESSKSFTLQPGTAGYTGFRPEMLCFMGVVLTIPENCLFDEGAQEVRRLFDGKGLEFCVPVYRRRSAKPRRTEVLGKAELVNITVEEANRPGMMESPYKIIEEEDDEPSGTGNIPTPTTTRFSGAGRLGVEGTSLFGLLIVTMCMLTI